jgi:hypothetical protein
VTGLGSSSSQLYALGTATSPYGGQGYIHLVETFSWTGTVGSTPYVSEMQGLLNSYDCAFADNLVWVACDGADSPVKAYNASGVLVDMIPGALVEGSASGLDFDAEGLLWVANRDTDKIYCVDLTQGTGGDTASPASLTSSTNPFMSSTVVSGTGFSAGARIDVFDLSGRVMESSPFDGTFVLDGDRIPAGTYVVVASDGAVSRTLMLVRL